MTPGEASVTDQTWPDARVEETDTGFEITLPPQLVREGVALRTYVGIRVLATLHGDDLTSETAERVAAALRVDQAAEIERLTVELHDARTNPRDAHHTMAELYSYRLAYHAHAVRGWVADGIHVVKSWRHSDGEACFGGGWFIVTAALPAGQVTNHYKAEHWDRFDVPEVDLAPTWDGHTPAIGLERLLVPLEAPGGATRLVAELESMRKRLADVDEFASRLAGHLDGLAPLVPEYYATLARNIARIARGGGS